MKYKMAWCAAMAWGVVWGGGVYAEERASSAEQWLAAHFGPQTNTSGIIEYEDINPGARDAGLVVFDGGKVYVWHQFFPRREEEVPAYPPKQLWFDGDTQLSRTDSFKYWPHKMDGARELLAKKWYNGQERWLAVLHIVKYGGETYFDGLSTARVEEGEDGKLYASAPMEAATRVYELQASGDPLPVSCLLELNTPDGVAQSKTLFKNWFWRDGRCFPEVIEIWIMTEPDIPVELLPVVLTIRLKELDALNAPVDDAWFIPPADVFGDLLEDTPFAGRAVDPSFEWPDAIREKYRAYLPQ